MPPPSLNDHRINSSITRATLSIICSTYQPVTSNSVNRGLHTPENAIIKSVKDPKVYKNCKIFVRSCLLIQVVSLLLRRNCYWTRVLSVFFLNGLVVLWFERAGFKRWSRVQVLGTIVFFFHLECVWIPFLWKNLWRAEVLHENLSIFVCVREVTITLKLNEVF